MHNNEPLHLGDNLAQVNIKEEEEMASCELIYKNGSLYIRPIQGKCIFINGLPISHTIEENGECKLYASDRLGFGTSFLFNNEQDDVNNKAGNNPRFVLAVSDQMDILKTPTNDMSVSGSSESMEDCDSDESVFEEEEETLYWKDSLRNGSTLLSKILSWLPFESLLETRQVSKLWKSESHKYFVSSSAMTLEPLSAFQDWEKDFRDYSANAEKFGHENFRVCYTGHPKDGFVDEDVLMFVRNHGQQIKKLELTIMEGRNDFAFLQDILNDPKMSNLEELRLTLITKTSDYTSKYVPLEVLQPLPSVKALSLYFDFDEEPPQYLKQFAQQAIHSFPNINKFQLNSGDISVGAVLEYIIVQEFRDCILNEDLPDLFSHLESIILNWATPDVVDLLIDFPKQLTTIEIHVERVQVDTSRLQNLLDAHAPNLKQLGLSIHCDTEIPVGEPQVLMPNFPMLKKLSYTLYRTVCTQEESESALIDPEIADIDLLNLRQMFLDGPEKMQIKFPMLHNIEIKMMPKQSESLFFQMFPEVDEKGAPLKFLQITQLKTTYPRGNQIAAYAWTEMEDFWGRIANLFPNVHSRELTVIREFYEMCV